MGVTIHFEGQLLSNVVYDDLIATITAIAERQNWLTAVMESAEVTLLRVRDEKDWDYTGSVKGSQSTWMTTAIRFASNSTDNCICKSSPRLSLQESSAT